MEPLQDWHLNFYKTMKIKKGDNVLITKGKDRGKKGKVLRVFPRDQKLMIEGLNMRKKHIRAKRAGEKGQMIEQATPVQVSNVKLICTKCGKATRVGGKIIAEKKVRICKICKEEL